MSDMEALSKKNRELVRTLQTGNLRPAKMPFRKVVKLMNALGAEIDFSRSGSRVSVRLEGQVLSFHVHDPKKGTIGQTTQQGLGEFLAALGVRG